MEKEPLRGKKRFGKKSLFVNPRETPFGEPGIPHETSHWDKPLGARVFLKTVKMGPGKLRWKRPFWKENPCS